MLVFQISLEGCGASTASTAATAGAYSSILSSRRDGLSLFLFSFSFFCFFLSPSTSPILLLTLYTGEKHSLCVCLFSQLLC